MSSRLPFFLELPNHAAFLGARAQRLADLIGNQGDVFLRAGGVSVPVRSVSTLLYLHRHGPASLVQIAKALGEPHQLTSQRTTVLSGLSMISTRADKKDRRRRLFALTAKGRREAERVDARCDDAVLAFDDLNRELAVDLAEVLDLAYDALNHRSMSERAHTDTRANTT